ncbi:MAG: carboxypeptidase regulatory-like domain-containing protein, partial [Acidimicrobiales bacterium]
NLGDASSDTTNNYDYYNIRQFYGPLTGGLDVRQVLVGTVVWNLPALRDRNRFLRSPFGSWQLSGIVHVQTGQYYTVTGTSAIVSGRLADYLGGPAVLPNPGPNGWFNRAAFAAAPQDRWGTAAPGDVEGPGLQIYDLSLTKFFLLSEARNMNLRVRADFVNAFNGVNFEGPNADSSASAFGTVSSAYPARNIQMGLKLQF